MSASAELAASPPVGHVAPDDAILVRGLSQPGALSGTVRISGAKNSALKLLGAALLAPGVTTIDNIPRISDIPAMADVLRHLGATVTIRPADEVTDTATIDVPQQLGEGTTNELAGQLRASLVVLGPLLARQGFARIAQPGGCNLGNRGIDLHLKGIEALGGRITIADDHFEAFAPDGLVGTDFTLDYASVGATENLMLAATTARGVTHLRNVAREPEIADLAQFIRSLGAKIEGEGTDTLIIEGVDRFSPTQHRVVGDRIEAGTFVAAAAMTGGDVTIEGIDPAHLARVLDRFEAAGVGLRLGEDFIRVLPGADLVAATVRTLPFPGFPTDMLAQFEAMLCVATGQSVLTENVYDGRFGLLDELIRLGADIEQKGHHIVIRGPRRLRGGVVRATDLRAGAALVLAGLVADGETLVCDPYHVDRGYADFEAKLRGLGADVTRLRGADAAAAAQRLAQTTASAS